MDSERCLKIRKKGARRCHRMGSHKEADGVTFDRGLQGCQILLEAISADPGGLKTASGEKIKFFKALIFNHLYIYNEKLFR
jgi:hypothetical protein